MKITHLIIVIIIVIIIYFTINNFTINNSPVSKIENFRSYGNVQDERYDLCPVYVNTFYNAHLNTKEEVKIPFLNWCNDFTKFQRHYPEYRTAEKVFLRLKRIYDGNY